MLAEGFGLRLMKPEEAAIFSDLEITERTYPWSKESFLDTLRSDTSRPLVWEGADGIIGFGVVQVVEGEAYLLNIMILPRHRRQGRGRELLSMIFDWAKSRGAERLFLDVEQTNSPALKLYEAAGLDVVGRRPHSYPGGEDSIMMKKDL